MPKCPYCGRWFRTRRGLRTHIGKVHMVDDVFGGRVLDPSTVDPWGYAEREMERAKKRRRKKGL